MKINETYFAKLDAKNKRALLLRLFEDENPSRYPHPEISLTPGMLGHKLTVIDVGERYLLVEDGKAANQSGNDSRRDVRAIDLRAIKDVTVWKTRTESIEEAAK